MLPLWFKEAIPKVEAGFPSGLARYDACEMPQNQEIARGLRQRAHELPPGDRKRYALFIAAKNIESHHAAIETDKQAREVKRVGPAVVNELMGLGVKASSSKRDRLYIEGANMVLPTKRHQLATVQTTQPLLNCEFNAGIALSLRKVAERKDGGFRAAILTAAKRIAQWPTELDTIQKCMAVPGVKASLATMIITEVVCRELHEDEKAFLKGAGMERQELGQCDNFLT